MAREIYISVKNQRATQTGSEVIVCGNEYKVNVLFDSEWDNMSTCVLRAVYVHKGQVVHFDLPFDTVPVTLPALFDTTEVRIGFYSGDVMTTTPARIACEPSIRCGSGEEATQLSETQYEQIMKLLSTKDAYYSTSTWIINNQTFEIMASDDMPPLAAIQCGITTFDPDHEYTVIYNGTEFKLKPVNLGIYALGNGSAMGGEDTGEPFLILPEMDPGAGLILLALDGSSTVTLSLGGEVVVPLDAKYLPPLELIDLAAAGIEAPASGTQASGNVPGAHAVMARAYKRGAVRVRLNTYLGNYGGAFPRTGTFTTALLCYEEASDIYAIQIFNRSFLTEVRINEFDDVTVSGCLLSERSSY